MLSVRLLALCLIAAVSVGVNRCGRIDQFDLDSSSWPTFQTNVGGRLMTYRLPPGGSPGPVPQKSVALTPGSGSLQIVAGVRFDRMRDGLHRTTFRISPHRKDPGVTLEQAIIEQGWMKDDPGKFDYRFVDLGSSRWLQVSVPANVPVEPLDPDDPSSMRFLASEAYYISLAPGYILVVNLFLWNGLHHEREVADVRRWVLREIVASIEFQ